MIFFLYLIAMCGYILSFRVQLNKNFVTRVTKAMEIKQDVQTSSVIKICFVRPRIRSMRLYSSSDKKEDGDTDNATNAPSGKRGRPKKSPSPSPKSSKKASPVFDFEKIEIANLFNINDMLGIGAQLNAAASIKNDQSSEETDFEEVEMNNSDIDSDDQDNTLETKSTDGLLPNLEDDFARLEANLDLDELNFSFGEDDDFRPNQSSPPLNEMELDEAFRGIEAGTLDLDGLLMGDERGNELNLNSRKTVEKLNGTSKKLNIDEERNVFKDDETAGLSEDEELALTLGYGLGEGIDDDEDLMLGLMGDGAVAGLGFDDDEDGTITEELIEIEGVDSDGVLDGALRRSDALSKMAEAVRAAARDGSAYPQLGSLDAALLDPLLDPLVDPELDLSDSLFSSSQASSSSDPLIIDGVELNREEFELGVDPPPLEEFRRLMESLGPETMFEDDSLFMEGLGAAAAIGDMPWDDDDDEEPEPAMVVRPTPDNEKEWRTYIYEGGEPKNLEQMGFDEEEREIFEDIHDEDITPSPYRATIVSVVTNSTANSTALDMVNTVYNYIREKTENDPRIRYFTYCYTYDDGEPVAELENMVQMWLESYNTYHLVDGQAMKEAWGCIMPHIMLSEKNLDAIVEQVRWALEEDSNDGAILTPRMRRLRFRGGAQSMVTGFNTEHLENEFSVVSVR